MLYLLPFIYFLHFQQLTAAGGSLPPPLPPFPGFCTKLSFWKWVSQRPFAEVDIGWLGLAKIRSVREMKLSYLIG